MRISANWRKAQGAPAGILLLLNRAQLWAPRLIRKTSSCQMLLQSSLLLAACLAMPAVLSQQQPNIILILSDDQDLMMNSTHPAYMPNVNKWIVDQGLSVDYFTACTSLCCPSRTNLMTGRLTHNTNLTSNQSPYGEYTCTTDCMRRGPAGLRCLARCHHGGQTVHS